MFVVLSPFFSYHSLYVFIFIRFPVKFSYVSPFFLYQYSTDAHIRFFAYL